MPFLGREGGHHYVFDVALGLADAAETAAMHTPTMQLLGYELAGHMAQYAANCEPLAKTLSPRSPSTAGEQKLFGRGAESNQVLGDVILATTRSTFLTPFLVGRVPLLNGLQKKGTFILASLPEDLVSLPEFMGLKQSFGRTILAENNRFGFVLWAIHAGSEIYSKM